MTMQGTGNCLRMSLAQQTVKMQSYIVDLYPVVYFKWPCVVSEHIIQKGFSQTSRNTRMSMLSTLFQVCHWKLTRHMKSGTLKYSPTCPLIPYFRFTNIIWCKLGRQLQMYENTKLPLMLELPKLCLCEKLKQQFSHFTGMWELSLSLSLVRHPFLGQEPAHGNPLTSSPL